MEIKMKREKKINKQQLSAEVKKLGKEERLLLTKIFFSKEKIYEVYTDLMIEHEEFKKSVISHLEFLQTISKAGLKEKDFQRFNGVINFCESFLIRNGLKDIKNNIKIK